MSNKNRLSADVCLRLGYDVDDFLLQNRVVKMSLSLVAESDCAVLEGEESVILAHADVLAREDIGAALAGNNLPNLCEGAWGNLDAEVLWIRISAVFSCSCGFFMCHNLLELAQ
jgi:hypothetical protein